MPADDIIKAPELSATQSAANWKLGSGGILLGAAFVIIYKMNDDSTPWKVSNWINGILVVGAIIMALQHGFLQMYDVRARAKLTSELIAKWGTADNVKIAEMIKHELDKPAHVYELAEHLGSGSPFKVQIVDTPS